MTGKMKILIFSPEFTDFYQELSLIFFLYFKTNLSNDSLGEGKESSQIEIGTFHGKYISSS